MTFSINQSQVDISTKLEIHFYQQDEVAFFWESNTAGTEEVFSKLLTFSSYTLRQFALLQSKREVSDQLVAHLTSLAQSTEDFYLISKQLGVTIIDYNGSPGRKNFICSLTYNPNGFRFRMRPRGFGFFSVGIASYVVSSIFSLIVFLQDRTQEAETFTEQLRSTIGACIVIYNRGTLDIRNYQGAAIQAALTGIAPDEV